MPCNKLVCWDLPSKIINTTTTTTTACVGKCLESISSHSRISAEFWAEFTTWRAEFQADKKAELGFMSSIIRQFLMYVRTRTTLHTYRYMYIVQLLVKCSNKRPWWDMYYGMVHACTCLLYIALPHGTRGGGGGGSATTLLLVLHDCSTGASNGNVKYCHATAKGEACAGLARTVAGREKNSIQRNHAISMTTWHCTVHSQV